MQMTTNMSSKRKVFMNLKKVKVLLGGYELDACLTNK